MVDKKNEAEKLANCYKNSLRLAEINKVETIAFPNISTGIYGFRKREAGNIVINVVREFESQLNTIKTTYFVCYDDENFGIYQSLINH